MFGLTHATAGYLLPRLVGLGFGVGVLAGFFGIGGGFLIVPALMLATGMALPNAIGTSLVGITAFGLASAASYAASGFIDWRLAILVIGGGVIGSIAGARLNAILAPQRLLLTRMFGGAVIAVGSVVFVRGLTHLLGASAT